MIRVIAVGKKHEPWVIEGIVRYEKRLKKPFLVQWVLLPHSSYDGEAARKEESQRIMAKISPDDFIMLLDERGTLFDSPSLSKVVLRPLESAKNVTMIIGGAFGVDPTIQTRADIIWSLSPLVFPHQLVRLLLIEQLYRVQEIINAGPYHHV